MQTGVQEHVLAGHADWITIVYALAISPDGKHVVTGSDDHTARMICGIS